MSGVLQIQSSPQVGGVASSGRGRFDPSRPSRLSAAASQRRTAGLPVRAWALAGALVIGTVIGGAISFGFTDASSPAGVEVQSGAVAP